MSDLKERDPKDRPGFALRGDALREVTQAVTAARTFERERRIRRVLMTAGGWMIGAFGFAVGLGGVALVLHRPVPRDNFMVSLLHDDGTYEPPVVREDLPRSQREMLFRHTVIQYVLARENYSWESVNANYRRVSAMSVPAERDRYQTVMLDRKSQENPAVLYGEGLSAATADVTGIQVQTDPAAQNAVAAAFVVKITAPNQAPRTIRKTARMTWLPAADMIPAEVQQLYDPLGIAFTHYSATPDPDATR